MPRTRSISSAVASMLVAASLHAQEPSEQHFASLDSLLNIPVNAAAKYEQLASEAPASITLVTRDQIDRHGFRTLEDVFRSIPGFYVSSDRSYSYLGVRGFGRPAEYNNRVLILLDGHPLNEAVVGAVDLGYGSPYNLDAVDHIEIVRGPGSALYGARAMFAVVNLVTKGPRDFSPLGVQAEFGSLGWKRVALETAHEVGRFNIAMTGHAWDLVGENVYFREFDAPATNDGMAEGLTWSRAYNGFLRVESGAFSVRSSVNYRDQAYPTAAFATVFNDSTARTRDTGWLTDVRFEPALSPGTELSIRAHANSFMNTMTLPYDDYSAANRIHGVWFGSEARLRWDMSQRSRLVFGTELQRVTKGSWRNADAATDETFRYLNIPYTIASLYLQDELQLADFLSVTMGVRYDHYSTVGSAAAPRFAAVARPWRAAAIKLLYGNAFRPPNLLEMNADEVLGLIRNDSLDAERIETWELGWEQRLASFLVLRAAVYRNTIDGFIDLSVVDTSTTFGFRYQNVQNLRAVGVESEVTAVFPMGLTASASYTFQDTEDRERTNPVSNSPTHLVRLLCSAAVGEWFTVGTNVSYESGRWTNRGTRTDPYMLADVTVVAKRILDPVTFAVTVRNVFDTAYELPGGLQHVQSGIPQPGRQLMLRARYDW